MNELFLRELLLFIRGEEKYSFFEDGIVSYPGMDNNNQIIHAGCLELARRGLICRRYEDDMCVVWMSCPDGE